ncbi:MAG: nitrite reductase (NAD(P)H), partial [Chitinophagaceae bacterium]
SRTATWLNKMEGGLAYLKTVIIDDVLGMNAQWEADMGNHVMAYACEWKAAIETPELRKRFTHFVNAPADKDPTVVFDEMREMKKAKEWK